MDKIMTGAIIGLVLGFGIFWIVFGAYEMSKWLYDQIQDAIMVRKMRRNK